MNKWSLFALTVLFIGLLPPHRAGIPVEGADSGSYHPNSFWYHPWGRSGTHKGVDVFARKGTVVRSITGGLVVHVGWSERGGNVVVVLGPKWRMHYHAHLHQVHARRFQWLRAGSTIGTVGDTGNARGKPPHLHYSIVTMIPLPWRIDGAPQGWKKMFYLDPTRHFPDR